MTQLRGQQAWSIALLQAWGHHEEARNYLDQLNRIQRAFDLPDYTMPEPAAVGLPDLVSCDAGSAVLDALGEQRRGVGDAVPARAVAAAQSRRVSPSRPSGLPSLSQRKSA